MRFAIIGAGSIGGFLAARLAAAGHDVVCLARGAHLAALRRDGLRLHSALGDVHARAVTALEDGAGAAPAEVAFVTVKLGDTEPALRQAGSLIGAATAVVTFQNGIEAPDLVAARLGRARTLGGAAFIGASIPEPGVVLHTGRRARFAFGELDGDGPSARAQALCATLVAAGVDADVPADLQRTLWGKFIGLSAMSATSCAARVPVGVVHATPELKAVLVRVVDEAVAVARSRGVAFSPSSVERIVGALLELPPDQKPSMLQDLEAGRKLELEWLVGAVARMAREAGLAAPASETLTAVLRPHAAGPPGRGEQQ